MYEELSIEALLPHPKNTNRISKMFSKKLLYNIQHIGLYETITVRPHPVEKNKFEILNGHVRLEALKEIGQKTVKCDIWNVDNIKTDLFLAILNKLRGSDVPELRMNLLFDLMKSLPKDELAAHIPETMAYLKKLEKLPEEIETKEKNEILSDTVVINFYLSSEKHKVIIIALNKIINDYNLSDSSEALFKLAQLYLDNKLIAYRDNTAK
jgi:hypothetical protein